MGNVFAQLQDKLGGNSRERTCSGPVVTDADRAIVSIQRTKRQLQDLKRRQDMLAERSLQAVVELLSEKKKDRARLALKKKKLHERQALQVESNILLLDERMSALETSAQQADLISALKRANGAIKSMQQQAPLEDVEKLLDENAEAAQYVTQMNDLLAGSGEVVPEGELDAELLQMEDELLPSAPPTTAEQRVEAGMAPSGAAVPAQQAATASPSSAEDSAEQLKDQQDQALSELPTAPTHKAEAAAAASPTSKGERVPLPA